MSSSVSSKRRRVGNQAAGSVDSNPFQEAALSNSVILRVIFSMLDESDLRNCAAVNKLWKEEACSLLPDSIRIESCPRKEGYKIHYLLTQANGSAAMKREVSWTDIINRMSASRRKKTYVHLMLGAYGHLDSKFHEEFVPRFGHLVLRLDVASACGFSGENFLKDLHTNFRNVKYISLKGSFHPIYSFAAEQEYDWVGFAKLEVVDFSAMDSNFGRGFIYRLLANAPNLKHCFNFPLRDVHSLVNAGKCGTVRSVVARSDCPLNFVDVFFATLASSEPKLTDYNWKLISGSGFLRSPAIQASLTKLFESSKYSMKSLVGPMQVLNYVQIPPMSALEHLKFEHHCVCTKEHPLFEGAASLREIFPSVKTVTISHGLKSVKTVEENFPREIFQPFGSSIKNLTVRPKVKPECVLELMILFPFVTNLNIQWSAPMSAVLDHVYKNLGQLRVLTLRVDHFNYFNEDRTTGPEFFDAAVTGLSVERCNALRNRKAVMRRNPGTLSNLKHFAKLRVIVKDKKLSIQGKAQNFITSVTIEYLKCFLPNVKVFIGIAGDCANIEGLKALLEPVLLDVECDACYDEENGHNVLS